jgi:hypothetical protein
MRTQAGVRTIFGRTKASAWKKRQEDHVKHLDHPKKLDWAKLPLAFRRICLELAREKGHPTGSALIGYTFVAPLNADGRIDPNLWHQYHDFCRVVRFRPDEAMTLAIWCASLAELGPFAMMPVAIRPMRRVIILALTGS